MPNTTRRPIEAADGPVCPRCGCADLAPVDTRPGENRVACNGCDLFFRPGTQPRSQRKLDQQSHVRRSTRSKHWATSFDDPVRAAIWRNWSRPGHEQRAGRRAVGVHAVDGQHDAGGVPLGAVLRLHTAEQVAAVFLSADAARAIRDDLSAILKRIEGER